MSTTEPETHSIRHFAIRTVFAVLWLIPIYFVVAAIIGALVGVLSGSSDASVEDAYAAAAAASNAFFERYGLAVILSVVAFVTTLSWYGMLPGTGKYKGISYGNRWKSLPPILRSIFSVVIVTIVAGLWGVFTVVVGAPRIMLTVGLFVIVAGLGVSLHRSSK